ncbi:MAG: hypothetical protein HRT77_12395 [Halioglobus sp.]|nr:hypothetical protein [Halioglobus sp.]
MNLVAISAKFVALLTLAAALSAARADNLVDAADHAQDASQEKAWHRTILQLEHRGGAYSSALSESLLGLARLLQEQGRHAEAIRVFRRGTHLTRINEGLYSAQQIPLVQGEIASHLAQGNFPLADERQDYLYRVQLESLQRTDQLAAALMAQAQWQLEAFQRGLDGPDNYARLMHMTELYRMAIQNLIEREGESSPNLITPLQGMLGAQYLISGYEISESVQLFGEDGRPNEALLRFKNYRARSYKQGNAIIAAIQEIEQDRPNPDAGAKARTLVMLGDWRLWNGKMDDAWEAYQAAQTELADADDAEAQAQALFGEPIALPDVAGVNALPRAVALEQGDILLAFGVSERGRVYDLERMDDRQLAGRQAYRLMRQLRKTPFRPRFEAGEPVGTEKVVRAFEVE